MNWGRLVRGVAEGVGLVADLVRADRDPGAEIRRIRIDEKLRRTEAAWKREISERFDDEPEPAPTTLPSSRVGAAVEDIYIDLDDEDAP